MAGHNKGSKAKRRNGALDRKPGKLLRELAKEITPVALTRGRSTGAIVPLRWTIGGAHRFSDPQQARAVSGALEKNLANRESALFPFKQNERLAVSVHATDEDCVLEAAPEVSAEKVTKLVETHLTITSRGQLLVGADSLMRAGLDPDFTGSIEPNLPESAANFTDEAAATQVLRFSEALQEEDELHTVHVKVDISEALLVNVGK
jgi:transcriptional/translational regulatory protein YebC/TACO1